MSDATLRRLPALALVGACLVFVLAGQAAGDRLTTSAGAAGTQTALGRAGFAYLTGLRTFAAAVLWNRLDPQHDTYYSGVPLDRQTFLLPTLRLVTWLDPRFVEAYYVAPWIVYRNGHKAEAVSMMNEAVRNNPDSGRLHAAFAQILLVDGRVQDAVRQADAARKGRWRDDAEEYEGYGILQAVYRRAGLRALEQEALAVQARIKAQGSNAQPGGGG